MSLVFRLILFMKLHTDHIINFESYQMTSFLLKEKSSKQSKLMRQDTFFNYETSKHENISFEYHKNPIFVILMFCTIWYHLCNLWRSEWSPWRSVTFSEVAG